MAKETYKGGSAPRPQLTPEQLRAVRLWVWGVDTDNLDSAPGTEPLWFSTVSSLADYMGMVRSTVWRWFTSNALFKATVEKEILERNKDDDMFYQRMRKKAQRTLEKNLDAPYARDSTAAAVAILGRAGDVDGIKITTTGDANAVVRGGYGRSGDDSTANG